MTSPEDDWYVVLRVSRDAKTDEIRTSFRKLAVLLHPDKGGDPDKFATLREAYEILSDPTKKSDYDRILGEDSDLLASRCACGPHA